MDRSETPVRLESAPAQDGETITGLRSALIDMTEQRNFERLETAHQLLNRKTAELRELSRQLISAEHRERERLAQVLHDHVQQLLVDVEQSMRTAGACEYFPKDAPAENLLSAIRRQLRSEPVRG